MQLQEQLLPQQQYEGGMIPGLDQPNLFAPGGSYQVQPAQVPVTTAQMATPELIAAAQPAYGYAGFPTTASQPAAMPVSPPGAYRTIQPPANIFSQAAAMQPASAYTTAYAQPQIVSRPGSMQAAPGQMVAGPYFPMQ